MPAERVWFLSPDDFERFVDRVFTRNGAMRVGNVGGGQKFSDFEIQFPLTDETAVVQVKSQTDQKELDRYVAELAGRPEDRLFFVYHSAPKPLTTDNPAVTIIGPDRLSELALRAGLGDWLVERAGRVGRAAGALPVRLRLLTA